MRLPPWAIEAIRNGVADVARKASDAETIAKVKDQAAELLRDLPESASRGLDTLVKTAAQTARDAVDQGRQTVRRYSGRQSDLSKPLVNASGVLFHQYGTGVALSDHVAQMGFEFFRGDDVTEQTDVRMRCSMEQMLGKFGYRVSVAVNLDAAIMSLMALAVSHPLTIHRSQAIRMPSGAALPELLSRAVGQDAGAQPLRECGGIQSIEANDFESLEPACIVLADNGTSAIVRPDLASNDSIVVAVAPYATLSRSADPLVDVKALIDDGIDLVICGGGPLIGSADCGILVGRDHVVDSIMKHPGWNTLQSSLSTAATVIGSLSDPDAPPLMQLIDTNEQNLRSRAERLATQWTANDNIESCQVTDQPAVLVRNMRWQFPSRQLRIRHQSLTAAQWSHRLGLDHLEKRDHVIAVGTDANDLIVDLRWVPASHDGILADGILETA
ncbi:MAG: hypothetical protein AAF745_13150 [Planctomycetota bacterium]